MDTLSHALEFHRQLRLDFQRREVVIADREAEARRALEDALQKCAADRAVIQQESELLNSVEVVYRHFLDRQVSQAQDIDQSAAAPVTGHIASLDTCLNEPARLGVSSIGTNVVPESADARWGTYDSKSDMASAITGFRARRLAGQHSQASDR